VRVNDRRVSMRMCVRPGVADRRVTWLVLMLVMDVVDVRVTVLEGLMLVLVLVALREVKPRPHRHQRCADREEHCGPLAEPLGKRPRPRTRREREIGACAGRAEGAEREHEQDGAHPVAQEAKQQRGLNARRGRRST